MQVNRINKFKRDRKLMDEALKSMRTKLWEHFYSWWQPWWSEKRPTTIPREVSKHKIILSYFDKMQTYDIGKHGFCRVVSHMVQIFPKPNDLVRREGEKRHIFLHLLLKRVILKFRRGDWSWGALATVYSPLYIWKFYASDKFKCGGESIQ